MRVDARERVGGAQGDGDGAEVQPGRRVVGRHRRGVVDAHSGACCRHGVARGVGGAVEQRRRALGAEGDVPV